MCEFFPVHGVPFSLGPYRFSAAGMFLFGFRCGRQEFGLDPQNIVEIIIPNHEHRHGGDHHNAFLAEAVQQALKQLRRNRLMIADNGPGILRHRSFQITPHHSAFRLLVSINFVKNNSGRLYLQPHGPRIENRQGSHPA